jgi:DNA polymerase III subunit chi
MPEVRFYHLERRKLEDALPSLLEEALAQGVKTIVEAPANELIEALDERLWTYSDDSFLPHGLARDGAPEKQPILLTTGAENFNGATWRILIGGAEALPALRGGSDAYDRLILLFDGADPEALAAARAQWAQVKASGFAPTYWRQDDTGRWAQAR